MRIIKYIFSILLIIWGLIIAWTKLFSTGLHFPFLTILTLFAIISGICKHKNANLHFILLACLWIVLSAENIGFVLFFDEGNFQRMIIGIIPFLLSLGVLFSTQNEIKFLSTRINKFVFILLLMLIGIGSYIYKPTIEELNCWYYLNNNKTYNVLFAKAPERTFEVELSSDELRKEVKIEAQKYQGRNGYYCPETKVRVVTCFGKIISAQIMSFRNSEKNKNVYFKNSIEIPLKKVNGKLEILKPFILRLWN